MPYTNSINSYLLPPPSSAKIVFKQHPNSAVEFSSGCVHMYVRIKTHGHVLCSQENMCRTQCVIYANQNYQPLVSQKLFSQFPPNL